MKTFKERALDKLKDRWNVEAAIAVDTEGTFINPFSLDFRHGYAAGIEVARKILYDLSEDEIRMETKLTLEELDKRLVRLESVHTFLASRI